MKLIYKFSGEEVTVGDEVYVDEIKYNIIDITPPHKPSSSGKVLLKESIDQLLTCEYYVDVIKAEWIEREDHEWVN